MSPDASSLEDIPRADNSACTIVNTPDKGRGLYASRFIPRKTIVEISPVLLFSKEEYEQHGQYTVLDHYTFVWTEGRMALALGLGSLFNHDQSPNVSYSLDATRNCIRYTTSRDVNAGEELCIFYGHKLWFTPADENAFQESIEVNDGWGGLATVNLDAEESSSPPNPYAEGDQDEIIAEDDLPFTRFKPPPEEEDVESIRTVEVWVVDVPSPKHITTLLKWLKQTGLDGELGHLKRIRKHTDKDNNTLTTLLLCPCSSPSSSDPDTPRLQPPQPPAELGLPSPYMLTVPSSSALTPTSLALKSALWPTLFTPRRKDEPEAWTRGKVRWAWDAMHRTVGVAAHASEDGELSVGALIPEPIGTDMSTPKEGLSFSAGDTRHSTGHPLRHAAINAVRQLADHRAAHDSKEPPPIESSDAIPTTDTTNAADPSTEVVGEGDEARNGSNYLLTDRTFFISHEPCIMCSMALLHSRVKEVVYMYPMPQTGGCGGAACLPILKGVNHRFSILQWKLDHPCTKGLLGQDLALDVAVDA